MAAASSPVGSDEGAALGCDEAVGCAEGVALGWVLPPQEASIETSRVIINTVHRSFVLFLIRFSILLINLLLWISFIALNP
jgi:hypothetical protein